MGGGDDRRAAGLNADALVERLLAAGPRAGATRVLAVDGRSGAGKSTLAAALAERLAAPVVALEALYGGWDGLQAGADRLVDDVLEPLARTGRARVPDYDWRARAWREPWALEAPPCLVVEGVGAGVVRAAALTSLLVWVEVDATERRRRALARDGALYGPHWTRWAAQEDALLARERTPERADVVVG